MFPGEGRALWAKEGFTAGQKMGVCVYTRTWNDLQWHCWVTYDLVWHHFCLPKPHPKTMLCIFNRCMYACIYIEKGLEVYAPNWCQGSGKGLELGWGGGAREVLGLSVALEVLFSIMFLFPVLLLTSPNIFSLTMLRYNWSKPKCTYCKCTIQSLLIDTYVCEIIAQVKVTDLPRTPDDTSLPLFPFPRYPLTCFFSIID